MTKDSSCIYIIGSLFNREVGKQRSLYYIMSRRGRDRMIVGYIVMTTYAIAQIQQSEGVRVMVFNTTFNNVSAISWRSVLLV
jgi:hypothetical protein